MYAQLNAKFPTIPIQILNFRNSSILLRILEFLLNIYSISLQVLLNFSSISPLFIHNFSSIQTSQFKLPL